MSPSWLVEKRLTTVAAYPVTITEPRGALPTSAPPPPTCPPGWDNVRRSATPSIFSGIHNGLLAPFCKLLVLENNGTLITYWEGRLNVTELNLEM